MTAPRRTRAVGERLCLIAALAVVPAIVAATREPMEAVPPGAPAPWKINTHLFAANIALGDAIGDGAVTIPPFGEIPIAPAALSALREAPAAYRAGVLAPDLFPDMFVGGWTIHSDMEHDERWIADSWLRHVWTRARAWDDPSEKDKVMAFAYGFLTHGAGDMFAHTWVNEIAEGAWVNFDGSDAITARRHIVLEGYVGKHTPDTDVSLDVWPKFVSDVLIRHPLARKNAWAPHYKAWLNIYDALEKPFSEAKADMNRNVDDDAPYWVKCTANPTACARMEYIDTWRKDIRRGLRAMVDSSESLGEALMDHDRGAGEGVGAMTGWAKEWLPKMYGAHAVGEGAAALSQFMDWIDQYVPIDSMIQAEVEKVIKKEMPKLWALYQMADDPATYMEQPGFFPAGTKNRVLEEMGVEREGQLFNWRAFAPIYNSVILSKLALLDANGLNELARRAGVSGPIVPAVDGINVMLGVFRSMTHSYQWTGDTIEATTEFGICGPENGKLLPRTAVCGIEHMQKRQGARSLGRATRGFVLTSNDDVQKKIFEVVFKGFGVGPGETGRTVAHFPGIHSRVPGITATRGTVRSATEHTAQMLETVANMRGKVGGVERPMQAGSPRPSVSTRAPARARGAPPRAAGAAATGGNWGQRCCAKDIAQIRAALVALHGLSPRLQQPAQMARLGRKASVTQIGARAAQANAALNAFAVARDAATATAALDNLSNHLTALAAVVAGTR